MDVDVEVVDVLVEVEVDVEVEVEVEVDVEVVDVDVEVEVEVVLVEVEVVEVESITKVLVNSVDDPWASTTLPVNFTVPKAFWSKGTVKLTEFCVSIFEFIRLNMMFDVIVLVTRKL